jgi:hypothetical protein
VQASLTPGLLISGWSGTFDQLDGYLEKAVKESRKS